MKRLSMLFLMLLPAFSAFAADERPLPADSIYQVKSLWVNSAGKRQPLATMFRGHPVVISMVYLGCQYSCPLTISHMQQIAGALPDTLKSSVTFVLVSFDPAHDTPKAMRAYEKKRHIKPPQWNFITTPSDSDIRELAALLDFKYKQTGDGEFDHSMTLIALDSDGVIKGHVDGVDSRPEELIPLLGK